MRISATSLLSLILLSAAACETTTDSGTDDASTPSFDAGTAVPTDGATSLPDTGFVFPFDGGFPFDAAGFFDAGGGGDASDASASDAGRTDAGATDAAAAGDAGPGVCGGSTPHGCWKPKAGNDPNCPPQIHEQSALYPPAEEWVACSSPYYQACIYLRPDGTEANCSCDLGLHWLCMY